MVVSIRTMVMRKKLRYDPPLILQKPELLSQSYPGVAFRFAPDQPDLTLIRVL